MGPGVGGLPKTQLIYILCSLTAYVAVRFQCKVDDGFTFLKR